MALPQIQQPLFDYTLPVSGIDITYRPFLVGEEKILLVGKESDAKAQINAMKQILSNVIVTPEDINIDELTNVDVEMVFIRLRAASVQNVVELKYRDNEDQKTYDFTVDLDELEPEIDKDRSDEIDLDGNVGMKLKDPTIGLLSKLGLNLDEGRDMNSDDIFKLIAGCIVSVWDSEQVYDDFSQKDALEFLQSMDVKRFGKIQEFFERAPKLTYTLNYTNSNGNKRSITLNGLSDFF